MKIIDCITYFNEPLLFDIRLNILNEHVDHFIVSEALYTHSGNKKKINFNKNDYPKFKHKISHIVVEDEPAGLHKVKEISDENNSLFRLNAAKRIEHQRNRISVNLKNFNKNDWIIYSDSDEIPDLTKINLKKTNYSYVLFNQMVFYYKFNLNLKSHDWFGSKACKIKDLKTISNLRNIKTKKYEWWRFDTFFRKDKFINLKIINNGGWHFTEIKKPSEIFFKHKNDEHHDEFDLTGITQKDVEKMVQEKYIPYNHSADKRDLKSKWNKKNRVNLYKVNNNVLPKYLIDNKNKYISWFD